LDGNSLLRTGVEGLNDLGIDESVRFNEDSRWATGPVVRGFAVNQLKQTRGKIKGCNEEFIKVSGFRHTREDIEEGGDLGRKHGTTGEQAKVGIKAGGARMVVARSEVEIGLEVVFLFADNEENLAVGF